MADYDYIIVGGGSAGCALANRVSEDPAAHVLLLGSRPTRRFDVDRHPGGLHEPAQPPALHFGGLPPSRSRTCTVARPQSRAARPSADRARSTAWSMCGNPLDYETWVQFGNRGWSYEGVLPYSRNPSITSRAAMARAVAAVRSTLPRCANAPSWTMRLSTPQWPRVSRALQTTITATREVSVKSRRMRVHDRLLREAGCRAGHSGLRHTGEIP